MALNLIFLFFLYTLTPTYGHFIAHDRMTKHGSSRLQYDYAILQKTVKLHQEISQMMSEQLSNVKNQLGDMKDQIGELESIIGITEEIEAFVNMTSSISVTTRSSPQTVPRCPDGWLAYNVSCYYFASNLVNFTTAKRSCDEKGGYLVRLQTREENEFLKNFMLSHFDHEGSRYWIGMSDEKKEGVWKIIGENIKVPFFDWGGSEPQNINSDPKGEDCAIFVPRYRYSWADVNCSKHKARPVCEKN